MMILSKGDVFVRCVTYISNSCPSYSFSVSYFLNNCLCVTVSLSDPNFSPSCMPPLILVVRGNMLGSGITPINFIGFYLLGPGFQCCT